MRSTDGIEDGIDPGGELVQCVDEVTVAVVDGLRTEALHYWHVGCRGRPDGIQTEVARQVE